MIIYYKFLILLKLSTKFCPFHSFECICVSSDLIIISDAMLQFVFPGVEILIALLDRIKLLLYQLLPLLVSERFPIESFELGL